MPMDEIKKAVAMAHAISRPWHLPVNFRQEGETLVGNLTLEVGMDLRKTNIADAERLIRAGMQQAIAGTMT